MSTFIKSNIRSNHVLASVIEEGIQIDAVKGAANAWAYLTAHSVDPDTILRVLSSTATRRRNNEYGHARLSM